MSRPSLHITHQQSLSSLVCSSSSSASPSNVFRPAASLYNAFGPPMAPLFPLYSSSPSNSSASSSSSLSQTLLAGPVLPPCSKTSSMSSVGRMKPLTEQLSELRQLVKQLSNDNRSLAQNNRTLLHELEELRRASELASSPSARVLSRESMDNTEAATKPPNGSSIPRPPGDFEETSVTSFPSWSSPSCGVTSVSTRAIGIQTDGAAENLSSTFSRSSSCLCIMPSICASSSSSSASGAVSLPVLSSAVDDMLSTVTAGVRQWRTEVAESMEAQAQRTSHSLKPYEELLEKMEALLAKSGKEVTSREGEEKSNVGGAEESPRSLLDNSSSGSLPPQPSTVSVQERVKEFELEISMMPAKLPSTALTFATTSTTTATSTPAAIIPVVAAAPVSFPVTAKNSPSSLQQSVGAGVDTWDWRDSGDEKEGEGKDLRDLWAMLDGGGKSRLD